MFLVNRLLGRGNTPATELATIDRGRLFLVRPESIKGSRECLFIDASLSIRRAPEEGAVGYELVVTRAFQEGEDQLLDEDAENSDERSFELDEGLFLSLGPTLDPAAQDPKPVSFTWLDPDGDSPEDEFEFVLSDEGGQDASEFERLAWRCMWERKHGVQWPTSPQAAKEAEESLERDFAIDRNGPATTTAPASTAPATPAKQQPLFRPATPESSDDDEPRHQAQPSALQTALTPARNRARANSASDSSDGEGGDSGDELAAQLMSKATITPSAKGKGKAKETGPSAAQDDIAAPLAKPPVSDAPASSASSTALVTVVGDLHLFDRATGLFMCQEEGVEAALHPTESEYWLLVQGKAGTWVSQGVNKDMVVNFSEAEKAMVFNFSLEEGGEVYTWLIRFKDEDLFNKMQEGISTALFEDKWGKGAWKKLKEDERDYQKTAYIEDAEMYGIEEENAEEQDEEPAQEEEDDEEEDSGEEQSDEDEREAFHGAGKKNKNSLLAVGYKEDLSFVVQGDMIGVFKQQREGGKKLRFVTSIVNLSAPNGSKAAFTPSKVMLHNQDTSMILQNPLAPGALYRLDLETGKVVDEYKVSDDFTVKSFLPDAKFAQTTQQQTFIGLSHNGVFRVDPRLAGSKLVDSEFKQYVTKNDFSVATTTESGRLAVASNKGDIRLFDQLGKNAKTALPALGDPILGIDVTADGRWVLATCKTYLLLIDTQIPDGAGRYAGQSGFDRSFPAAQKPTPRRLQLRPEHVAHMQEQSREGVSFTPAKFNAGLGEAEKTIVTSTGPYVVAWNFRHVKAGNVMNYTLRRFSDTVIADNFKFGGDREIIVTLPENVFVEDKKKLKAPTRESISSIVKTWD